MYVVIGQSKFSKYNIWNHFTLPRQSRLHQAKVGERRIEQARSSWQA